MSFNIDFNTDDLFNNIKEVQPEKNNFGADERFWKLSRNDDDIGLARIRLLPTDATIDGEQRVLPFIRVYKYELNVKKFGSKRFFTIDSPQNVGLPDPIYKLRSELYKIKDNPEVEKILEGIRRPEKYIANVFVRNDPIKPENTGRVALWEFGKKLKEKFVAWRTPSQEDIAMGAKPIDVWNLKSGNDIKLVMRKAGGFYNYDDTSYYDAQPITTDKAEFEKIMNGRHNATEWFSKEHYMSEDEIIAKLLWLFDGTQAEDTLKTIGSFLYAGGGASVAPTQVKAAQTQNNTAEVSQNTQKTENTQTTQSTPAPQNETPASENSTGDEELSFLDDF